MVFHFEKINGARVTYSGDDIPEKENAIVISNHLGFTDIYLLHGFAQLKKMLSAQRYFAKDSLKWMPIFGWGLYLMGFIFLKRDWLADRGRIEEVFSGIKQRRSPIWIVSYVEGSRITKEKLQKSKVFAKKRNLPALRYLMVPRTKGFVATINSFREDGLIKAVYDLTLIYYNSKTNEMQHAPNIARVYSDNLKEYKFHVHVKRHLIKDLPNSEEELTNWLLQQWKEKDDYLEDYRLKNNWNFSSTLSSDNDETDKVKNSIKKKIN
ncbi:hypothetical protein HDU92_001004 [Lobulomyces angularis]|nr:hypothetical protein HDU92_001004 [Lobulomyces angularis]